MSGLAARALFVVLAALTVGAGAARLAAPLPAPAPPLAARLAAAGFVPLGSADGVVLARAPGCARPVRATELGFDDNAGRGAAALATRDATLRYVYLGTVSKTPLTARMLLLWAESGMLHAIGLRAEPAPHEIVAIAAPRGCQTPSWSRLAAW